MVYYHIVLHSRSELTSLSYKRRTRNARVGQSRKTTEIII